MREQHIVIAVLPPVLETPYARAAEGLHAGDLVRVIERLVLEELKPRLPANESWLIWVFTENQIPGRVRRIGTGVLLDRACGECRWVSWIPWNQM